MTTSDFEAQAREILSALAKYSMGVERQDTVLHGMTSKEAVTSLVQLHESEVRNQTNKVTRFEVIDHSEGGTGRDFVKYGVKVELSLQDDGRTLKVFLTSEDKEKDKTMNTDILDHGEGMEAWENP